MIKRLFDIVLSATALVVFLPVLLIAGLAIRLESTGPVIFRQTRVGRHGQPFSIYKLRSMRQNAEREGFATREGDSRITKVGKIIRKTSIDELPQLINVLKGDMSLVGPRPDVPAQQASYAPEQWQKRHQVRPGITGLAQARLRSSATPQERTALDLEYVDQHSFRTDLKIIFETARKIAGASAT